MARAISVPLREEIWKRSQQGASCPEIARQLGLSPRTVRHLVTTFRQRQGKLEPEYDQCGPEQSQRADPIRDAAVLLRQEHPQWGAGLIRTMLLEQFDGVRLPAVRTFRRWLHQEQLSRQSRPTLVRAQTEMLPRAQRPHRVWQIDGVEQLPLTCGEQVCWVRAVDEHTTAVLGTVVFSPKLSGLCGSRTGLGSSERLVCPIWGAGVHSGR